MTTNQTPNTRGNIIEFLDALENPKKALTLWEQDFITSITDQFNMRGTLSDKQFNVLERIYAEKT